MVAVALAALAGVELLGTVAIGLALNVPRLGGPARPGYAVPPPPPDPPLPRLPRVAPAAPAAPEIVPLIGEQALAPVGVAAPTKPAANATAILVAASVGVLVMMIGAVTTWRMRQRRGAATGA